MTHKSASMLLVDYTEAVERAYQWAWSPFAAHTSIRPYLERAGVPSERPAMYRDAGEKIDRMFWLGEVIDQITNQARRDLPPTAFRQYETILDELRKTNDHRLELARLRKNPPRGVRVQRVIATVKKDMKAVGRTVGSPQDAIRALAPYIHDRASEVFVVLFIDVRNRLVGYTEMTEGSPTGVSVHPQGIFKEALLCNGAAFITAHQHPSGAPDPSAEDRALWARLRDAGTLMGIPCLDNFVLGERAWYSESEGHELAYPTNLHEDTP